MRGVRSDALRDDCLRLRVEERLSLNEIHVRTGAPKGTLSGWLREHPLTEDERRSKINSRGSRWVPKKNRGEESVLHQMAQGRVLSHSQKGKIAEAAVLIRLLIHGFNPFTSIFDGDLTDWLTEIPSTGKVWKIQVKLAVPDANDKGLPSIRLKHDAGKYKRGDFDFIAVYDLFTDTCYVWSWDEVVERAWLTIKEDARERWDKLLRA